MAGAGTPAAEALLELTRTLVASSQQQVQMNQDAQARHDQSLQAMQQQILTLQQTNQELLNRLDTAAQRQANAIDEQRESAERKQQAGRTPEAFSGEYHDWPGWKEKIETAFAPGFKNGQKILDWAQEKGGETDITKDMIEDLCREEGGRDAAKFNEFLYAKLIECLKPGTEPFNIVQNSGKTCGLNAWRRLNHRYDPDSVHTNLKILGKLMRPPKVMLSQLRNAIETWERSFASIWSAPRKRGPIVTRRVVSTECARISSKNIWT